MRLFFAVAFSLVMSLSVQAQDNWVVMTPKKTPTWVVVPPPKEKAKEGCQCGAGCPCLTPVVKTEAPKPVTAQKVTPLPVQTSSAVGYHTHTCVNGHTWDHSNGVGHNCPVCGMAQYVQDSPRTTVQQYRPAVQTYSPQPVYYQPAYSFAPTSGCANGQCGTTVRYVR